jgi:hypothetical protein
MQLGIVDGERIGSQLKPQQGFRPVGLPAPGGWGTAPSPVEAVAASVTVTTTGTLDWSAYGVFQFLLTASNAFAPTFTNVSVGQTIFMLLKQPASVGYGTLTLPTGTILAGTAAASITLGCASTASGIDCIRVTCTAPGVYIATQN